MQMRRVIVWRGILTLPTLLALLALYVMSIILPFYMLDLYMDAVLILVLLLISTLLLRLLTRSRVVAFRCSELIFYDFAMFVILPFIAVYAKALPALFWTRGLRGADLADFVSIVINASVYAALLIYVLDYTLDIGVADTARQFAFGVAAVGITSLAAESSILLPIDPRTSILLDAGVLGMGALLLLVSLPGHDCWCSCSRVWRYTRG